MSTFGVSVVVPTHNRLPLLREAVGSVRDQPDVWELIVVVDASSDGTLTWLSELEDVRISVIPLTEPSERAEARNQGLMAARGRYVLFLDDDDLLVAGALGALASTLDATPAAVAAVAATVAFDARGHRRRLPHPRRKVVRDVFPEAMFGWPCPPGCTLFRTEMLRSLGGWPTGFVPWEDQDLWLRVASQGPVVLLPQPALQHRLHGGQRRPEDPLALKRALREAFLETLSGEARKAASHLLRARSHYESGVEAWERTDLRQALRHFAASVAAAPRLAFSPITGARLRSLLLRCVIGAVIGRRAMAAAQRIVWAVRLRWRRAPGAPEDGSSGR